MADEENVCDNCDEDVKDIRELVERIAKRQGFENPRCTGFVMSMDFLDDVGDHKWAYRCDPDQGNDSILRLGKIVEIEVTNAALVLFNMVDNDG